MKTSLFASAVRWLEKERKHDKPPPIRLKNVVRYRGLAVL